jgi:hypothetical protein
MTKISIQRALTPFVIFSLAQSAVAQQAVLDHCRNTSSDTDRIACLEAALLGKEAMLESEPEKVVAVAVATEVEPVPEAVAVGIGADQVITRNETREESIERLEVARGLVVASYDKVPYERMQVTLENGQVWRQIKGDTQQIRVDLKRNQTVDITESSLSGYKLRLNEMRRMIRVERVR